MQERKNTVVLGKEESDSYYLISNKIKCAKQALHPGFIDAADREAGRIVRDAIFALADYQALQNNFWRELAARHGIKPEHITKLRIDFAANRLYIDGEQ
ncbi:hypothetical protein NO1_2031 [Candidatus Termititenax aidoneus]|uniref:Uncharacterized protein n=1 Tax=Termititenax aidoneus TaxID=2218524 RepID=A0A388TEG6_TERA1|nr:hypothetical protein NO1_2031 [Candidatus Termititenax aidoneus]